MKHLGLTLIVFLFSSLASTASPQPGEISQLVKDQVEALKRVSFSERLKIIQQLKITLEIKELAGEDEAISFIVALDPLFENSKDLGNESNCRTTRKDILFLFESGTAYDGKLPYFVPESLEVLAAICGDENLSRL